MDDNLVEEHRGPMTSFDPIVGARMRDRHRLQCPDHSGTNLKKMGVKSAVAVRTRLYGHIQWDMLPICFDQFNYCKAASSNTSCLEALAGFFRLLMKAIFLSLCTVTF